MPAAAYLRATGSFEVGNTGLSGKRSYVVVGANTDDDAYGAARAKAIQEGFATYFGIPIGSVSGEHLGGDVYHVDINYDPRARTEGGEHSGQPPAGGGGASEEADPTQPIPREWTLSTGGGTRHITRSIKVELTIEAGENGGTRGGAPYDNKLIGHDESGVAGIDIEAPQPVIRFNDKVRVVTLGYFLNLCELTGTTNHAPWKGIKRRCGLLGGVDLHYKDGDAWDRSVTIKYSAPNKEEVIGLNNNQIKLEAEDKMGWEYLDIRYEKGSLDGEIMLLPKRVYIHQVYEDGDFDQLQI